MDLVSGKAALSMYSLSDKSGNKTPIPAGATSRNFLFQVAYQDKGLYMNVYNRKGLKQIYQSVGFIDFGYLELDSLHEVMFMTVNVAGRTEYQESLVRVALDIDPNDGSLLQKTEVLLGLPGNCATSVKVTKYLIFVGCSKRGLMEVFRSDSLDKVDILKISYFTEDWSVLETMGGAHVFLFMNQPDSKLKDKANRLTIYEYIVNTARLLKQRGSAPIFH